MKVVEIITEIWHPNVDKNGDDCISDKYGYEKSEERWLPTHTVGTITITVISILADHNGESPAKEWKEDRNGEFKRKAARRARKSRETAFE
uniref:UBC core domain-containing protein n=1 Tax=Ictidomys tridecemlineatus TaxID=43179 RepID=A0A287CXL4_ICTTR